MKYLAGYVAFVLVISLIGIPWYQAAMYPVFVIFIYGIFYAAFKTSPQDSASIVFGIIALLIAIPITLTFGKPSRHSIDDRPPYHEDH